MARTYSATRYAGDTGVPTTVVAVGDDSGEASPVPFGARVVSVTVDFGISGDHAKTSVSGVPWVKSSPRPLVQVVGRPTPPVTTAGADDEDVLVNNVRALITNIVDGTSFDVVALATETTNGIYTVQIMGVG